MDLTRHVIEQAASNARELERKADQAKAIAQKLTKMNPGQIESAILYNVSTPAFINSVIKTVEKWDRKEHIN